MQLLQMNSERDVVSLYEQKINSLNSLKKFLDEPSSKRISILNIEY